MGAGSAEDPSAPIAARSYLYVPGYRGDRFENAIRSGADAIIIDFEDSVPVARKDEAREVVRDWLARSSRQPIQVWVRVNAESLERDLAIAVHPHVLGVVMPKADRSILARAATMIDDLETAGSLRSPHSSVIALVESAASLMSVVEVASSPRVVRLGLGEADLMAGLGLVPEFVDDSTLTVLRLPLVLASAAAGLGAPVGPASLHVRDLDGLHDSTERLLHLGFQGRTCIHPAQVPVVNEVFTASPDELERARKLVAAYERSLREGEGVLVDESGKMVDIAVVLSARRVLERARGLPPEAGAD